ncbi:PAS domain-containing sensor histidine kinase [Blastochloris viridis]|uniref:histidine kinase n=1 Tax=Blastochloris viridis TaxID=1079 RepID=A0A0H5BPK9_BLAVI|nr:PAS domain-containing sensor histidine kinase [Blastochloris viridis]ALK10577.1 Cell-division control histidine kinase PdhS [Blastochloris viridis]BAR99468.1 sensory histidine kinase AtoS [Blastochloris viridis]CUU43239.1 Cell-division control histidine kinase pdhS [Blastochloris viridis]
MIDLDRLIAALSDATLAGLLVRRGPAWALLPDATVVLANARGLAALGGAETLGRALPEAAPLRRELGRLRGVLSRGGETRLERLRLPGARFAPVTSACRRLTATALGDLIAIASLEEGGDAAAPLAEVARLIAAIAAPPVFVADAAGTVLARSPAAVAPIDAASLNALVGDAPAWIAEAASGPAVREVAGHRITLQALAVGGARVLLGWLKPAAVAAPPPAAPVRSAAVPTAPIAPVRVAAGADVAAAIVAEPVAAALAPVPEPPVPEPPAEPATEPPAEPPAELPAEATPEAAPEAGSPAPETAAPTAPALPVTDMPPIAATAATGSAIPARRLPLRFVWQTDAAGRLTQVSPELAEAVGQRAADVIGRTLAELADRLGFDADGRIGRALAKHDTWSGVNVMWSTDYDDLALVDLAGLPVFDRARVFQGYRGFGVCRALRSAETAPAPLDQPAPPPARSADANVVQLRTPAEPAPAKPAKPETPRSALSAGERVAFREIGRMLGAIPDPAAAAAPEPAPPRAETAAETADRTDPPDLREPEPPVSALADSESPAAEPQRPDAAATAGSASEPTIAVRAVANGERAVLERLPLAVLVYRGDRVLFANPALLDWVGLGAVEEVERAGGVAAVFDLGDLAGAESDGKALSIRGAGGRAVPVEARLFSAPWQGEVAMVLVLRRTDTPVDERLRMLELALRTAEAAERELRAILDTATDGVVITDRDGRILSINGAAEALFGYDGSELASRSFGLLFAPESQRAAFDYIDGLLRGGVASVLNDGREVIGRVREGGLIPLFMTMGRITEDGSKFCAVFRDITQWKRAEEELVTARQAAERANSHKSDFLAKISHEIRTPLNAIIGFSEVMMEERFGSVGNPRYKDYLKDIHTSGTHVVSLVNDLLDLSKIEAGKLDLDFVSVDLNDVLTQCMALMQPQANRERIIIRTSLAPRLPPVVADARSMRQVALNLLSNSIRFTQPGGQVILSTALSDAGEVVMRVRDTGVGMSEADIAAALEPFRQITTSSRGPRGDGTGLGLPLTKALVEANRAAFAIRSSVNAGTMVEVIFPPTRVLAE